MARNVQIWTENAELLLDGPHASPADIKRAMRTIKAVACSATGFCSRPCAWASTRSTGIGRSWRTATRRARPCVLPDAPLGYLTAYDADKPRLDRAVELWPRMQRRPVLLAALAGEDYTRKRQVPPQVRNVRKLTHAYALFGAKPLPINFARRIMGLDRGRRRRALAGAVAGAGGGPDPRDRRAPTGRAAFREARPSPGIADVRAHGSAVVRGAPTGRRSLPWPRRHFSTRTTPTASSTRRRSACCPITSGTSNASAI